MRGWMVVLIFAVAAILLLSVTKDIIIKFSAEQGKVRYRPFVKDKKFPGGFSQASCQGQ